MTRQYGDKGLMRYLRMRREDPEFNGRVQEVVEDHLRAGRFSQSTFVRQGLDGPEHPERVGNGPDGFSTCVALDLPLIWDVNGYYRDLGVGVRATRREIKEAYQKRRGEGSRRLTMIVKVLLDRHHRRIYDSTQPGFIFVDDEVMDRMRREAAAEAARKIAGGVSSLEAEQGQDYLDGMLDTASIGRQAPSLSHPARTLWSWSFYQWRTRNWSIERLREWQELLVRALAEKEVIAQIGIGVIGGSASALVVEQVGDRLVVFLNVAAEPTDELARIAAHRVVQHQEPERAGTGR